MYIKYALSDGWNWSDLNAYQSYFLSKWNALINVYSVKFQELLDTSKIISGKINGESYVLNTDMIAEALSSSLNMPNLEDNISALYSTVINNSQSVLKATSQYGSAVGNLLAIRNGLIPEGSTFEVNAADQFSLDNAMQQGEMLMTGGISNTLGKLGEAVSSLAGAAASQVVFNELTSQLSSSQNISLKSSYTNVGSEFINGTRRMTDNQLSIEVFSNGVSTGVTLNFNFSDKANKGLAKLSPKRKSTQQITVRSSTVAALSDELDRESYYNTISYHLNEFGKKISGMHSGAGVALSNYYGYKLMIDAFIERNKDDKIDFVVYGNRIIPESRMVNELLKLKQNSNKNFKYQAQIRYYMLVDKNNKSNVRNADEAERVIDKMAVQLRSNFAL